MKVVPFVLIFFSFSCNTAKRESGTPFKLIPTSNYGPKHYGPEVITDTSITNAFKRKFDSIILY